VLNQGWLFFKVIFLVTANVNSIVDMKAGLYPKEFNGFSMGDIYIHEPGGMISNILVMGFSLWFAIKLISPRSEYGRNWRNFYFCLSFGTLGGAVIHGLPHLLSEPVFYYIWAVKNSFVPIANFFAMMSLVQILAKKGVGFWRQMLALKCALSIISLWWFYSFLPAVIDLAITYLLIIAITSKNDQIAGFKTLRTSFIIAVLSGTLYIVKYDLDPLWFTHKDMVHIFVLINLYLVYRSVNEYNKSLPLFDLNN
jgi:hypothetical protein